MKFSSEHHAGKCTAEVRASQHNHCFLVGLKMQEVCDHCMYGQSLKWMFTCTSSSKDSQYHRLNRAKEMRCLVMHALSRSLMALLSCVTVRHLVKHHKSSDHSPLWLLSAPLQSKRSGKMGKRTVEMPCADGPGCSEPQSVRGQQIAGAQPLLQPASPGMLTTAAA